MLGFATKIWYFNRMYSFFCQECIQYHLKTVMNSGKFPGYCPVCEASAPKGEVPRYGKIIGKVCHFRKTWCN